MVFKLASVVAVCAAIIVNTTAYPYLSPKCWFPVGGTAMGQNPVNSGNNIALSFSPALKDTNKYTPGQKYVVTVTGSKGIEMLLGTSSDNSFVTGTWDSESCSKSNTVGIGGTSGSWVAPGSGSVKIGGSRGGPYGTLDSIEMTLEAGSAPAPPTTAAPSPAPTAATKSSISTFCTEFIDTCGTGLGWSSSEACVADAKSLIGGTQGQASGNTFECRVYHLGVAKQQNRALHCSHAAKQGNGVCVGLPKADEFCTDFKDTCDGVDGLEWKGNDCAAKAKQVPVGIEGDTGGNSLACRIYHLGVAKVTNTAFHCSHASGTGAGVCVNTSVDTFCDSFIDTCGTGYGDWSDKAECVKQAEAYIAGSKGAVTGNTLACREYHLGVAAAGIAGGKNVHCPHAAHDGGNVCVQQPTTADFCADFIRTCGDEDGWASDAACVTSVVSNIKGDPATAATSKASTLACRQYNLGQAKLSTKSTKAFCDRSGVSGGDTCTLVPTSEEFCAQYEDTCGGDMEDCLENYRTTIAGTVGSTGGDTQACRTYHLGVAMAMAAAGKSNEKTVHCGHASEDGGGICVSRPTVNDFCNDHVATCGADSSKFGWTDSAQCATIMKQTIPGATGATQDDTLECRMYHLGVAKKVKETSVSTTDKNNHIAHCTHASKDGGGVCIGNPKSDAFCENLFDVCDGTGWSSGWEDEAACTNKSVAGSANRMVAGSAGATSGNTLACRIYHLREARYSSDVGAKTAHCNHASENGGGVCSDTASISEFCTFFNNNCDDERWHDEASCAMDAVKFPKGTPGEAWTNTLECRAWHVSARHGTTNEVHCNHASYPGGSYGDDGSPSFFCTARNWTGTTWKGEVAATVCKQYEANCGFGGDGWADQDACVNAMKTKAVSTLLTTEGPWHSNRDDTMFCRSFYLGETGAYKGSFNMLSGFNSKAITTYSAAVGTAELVSLPEGRTVTRVQLQGDMGMANLVFKTHLHAKPCSENGGGHYQDPDNNGPATSTNENWPTVSCDSQGICYGAATSMWNPSPKALAAGLSIVIHDTPNAAAGSGAKLFCADLVNNEQSYCAAAGPSSDVCKSPADQVSEFCDDFVGTCGEGSYGDSTACQSSVVQMLFGEPGATSGNTLECRRYHLGVAAGSASSEARAFHCGHAGQDGAGVCVGQATPVDFCDTFMDHCGTEYGWSTTEECEAEAETLAVGTAPDTNGNTLECRAYHLGVSRFTAKDAHCTHAGAAEFAATAGKGVPCAQPVTVGSDNTRAGFCSDFINVCGTDYGWADASACGAEANFMLTGAVGDTGGDTFECRVYHLGVAAKVSGQAAHHAHCTHASRSGGGVCVASDAFTTTNAFCKEYSNTCAGTVEACEAEAVGFIAGAKGDTGGDTLACRSYHVRAAALGAAPGAPAHCTHASVSGGGVCVGATVEAFCESFVDTCTSGDWTSASECVKDAAALVQGEDGAFTGSTLECRAYHLGVARKGAANVHCPHADKSGGGVCAGNPTVAEYCSELFATCDGAGFASGYDSEDDCVAKASSLISGQAGATGGNTLACRVYHLGIAKSVDAAVHCPHASMDGGGVCAGDVTTKDFCDDFVATCASDADWTSAESCRADAELYEQGLAGAVSGDSLECRSYHLGVAKSNPGVHCPHASKSGGGVCEDKRVPAFCKAFISTCGDADELFSSQTECVANAGALIQGKSGATGGDTLSCREYHLGVAMEAPSDADVKAHCGHASSVGNDVCVGNPTPEEFCQSFKDTCGFVGSAWSDADVCEAATSSVITGAVGATGGDTFSCRVYHLGVAQTNAKVHCAHADVDGGGVCVGSATADEFCADFVDTCDTTDTVAECVAYATKWSVGVAGAVKGDSLSCRLYHLTVAKSSSDVDTKAFHCGHASEDGDEVCFDSPDTKFCTQFLETCGDNFGYSNVADCKSSVAAMVGGNATDTGVDTFACRQYHLSVALTDASTHCPHAGLNGGGVCVTAPTQAPTIPAPTVSPIVNTVSGASSSLADDEYSVAIIVGIVFGVIAVIVVALLVERSLAAAKKTHEVFEFTKKHKPDFHNNPVYQA
eukprot:m.102203 g.102203  ORF g.102203 m.102203 type:complete len:2059 (-) comp27392_c1_seq4:256-6432(-)